MAYQRQEEFAKKFAEMLDKKQNYTNAAYQDYLKTKELQDKLIAEQLKAAKKANKPKGFLSRLGGFAQSILPLAGGIAGATLLPGIGAPLGFMLGSGAGSATAGGLGALMGQDQYQYSPYMNMAMMNAANAFYNRPLQTQQIQAPSYQRYPSSSIRLSTPTTGQ